MRVTGEDLIYSLFGINFEELRKLIDVHNPRYFLLHLIIKFSI